MQGDIVAFVGDGVVALWDSGDLMDDARRAVSCGLALQQSAPSTFRTRVSIDCGEVRYCRVGGTGGRWRYLVVGDPIANVGAAYRHAAPGETIACPQARAILGSALHGEPIEGGCAKAIAVDSVRRPAPAAEEPSLSLGDLRPLLPTVVLERGGGLTGRWLAELRNLSIAKISLNEMDAGADILAVLHEWMASIESASRRLEGEVAQVQMDDKGVSAAVIFGLPTRAHEDDPFRAVEAALAIHEDLSERRVRVSIGVTTGLLFCGEFGGDRRRDYSAIGVAMNLAARLMEVAEDGVMCDAATATAVESRVSFSQTTTLNLKGWPSPVAAFRLELISAPVRLLASHKTIGRERERRLLRDALTRLARGEGGVVRIAGDAGIGKSTLLLDLMEQGRRLKLGALFGHATAIDRATPYYAWRDVLNQLLQPYGPRLGPDLLIDLGAEPRLAEWLPLLEDVTPLSLVPTTLTRSMLGSSRASGIEELIVFFLRLAVGRQPTLLAFDDAHWMDGASASLVRAVAHRLPGLLLVVARRSAVEPEESGTASIEPDVDIALEGLPGERLVEIVCQRLGVSSVPDLLARLIVARAAGNPFYCEELTFAMRDTGVLRVEHGECLTADNLNADISVLPTSIKNIVVARFDTLPPDHRMVLKVASALGGAFSPTFIKAVHPSEAAVETIRELLDDLVARSMLKSVSVEPERHYEFRHALFESAIYGSLSFSQRRELHAKAAMTIESRHGFGLEPFHAQLARHWELAEQPSLAIEHLDRAADHALRNYANRDAIQYAERAIRLAHSVPAGVDDRRRAAWEITLGDAHHELREYEKASEHYESALVHLGLRTPATHAQTVRSLLSNAAQQAVSRIWGPAPLAAETRVDMQRAAHVYERLSEEYFYLNDTLRILHGTLASLNLAERSGSTAETISGYNGLALGLGMSGLPGPARFYSRKAFALARDRGGKPEVARANLVAGVLASGLGERQLARALSIEAAALFRELGDQARLQNVLVGMTFEHMMHSDIASAEHTLGELAGPDYRDANDTIRAWRLCARVAIDTIRGEIDQAALSELLSVAEAKHAPADRLLCLGVLASAHERRGGRELASAFARRGFDVLQSCRVVWSAYGVYGATGVVGTLVADWERAAATRSYDRAAEAKAHVASRMFYRAARASPMCRPAALIYRGSTFFLSGQIKRAVNYWRGAVHCAEDLHMEYFLGLAWFQIAKSSVGNDAARELALSRAERAFEAVGATVDLSNVRLASIQFAKHV